MQEVSKNRGISPKMDGENNEKTPIKMDDLGGFPYFWKLYKSFTFTTRAELVSDLTSPHKTSRMLSVDPWTWLSVVHLQRRKKTPF